jgi:hypothetical protein
MTDYEEMASLLNVPYSSSKSYSYQNLGPWSNNAQVVDIPSLMSGIDHNTAAD